LTSQGIMKCGLAVATIIDKITAATLPVRTHNVSDAYLSDGAQKWQNVHKTSGVPISDKYHTYDGFQPPLLARPHTTLRPLKVG